MDRGAWRATVQEAAKELDITLQLNNNKRLKTLSGRLGKPAVEMRTGSQRTGSTKQHFKAFHLPSLLSLHPRPCTQSVVSFLLIHAFIPKITAEHLLHAPAMG